MPRWTFVAFAGLCVATLAGTLLYPTWPTYDSYYALLWGRELLDGELPGFEGFRAPTQHPLAIAVAAVLNLFGDFADRLWIFLILAGFVALVAGIYRLAAVAFTPLVGAIAALLALSRFDFAFLAVRGYIDIPYLALVVWAVALEAQRPRRGTAVFALLAAAGLLRPEAWLLAGLYWLWVNQPGRPLDSRRLALSTAWAAAAPVLWVLTDLVVTGDPLFSLNSTSASAEDLGRSVRLSEVPGAVPDFLTEIVKLPVMGLAAAGAAVAVLVFPRRAVWPGVLTASGVVTFVAIAAAGLSAIERYLVVAALGALVFAAVALGGWTLLEGGRLRTGWMALAGVAVAFGVFYTVTNVDLRRFDDELSFRGDAHASLVRLLDHPEVRAGLGCGELTLPNHKLVPDARYLAGLPAEAVRDRVRSREQEAGVAIVVLGRFAVFKHAWSNDFDPGASQLPPAGFELVARTNHYAAYARCA